MSTFLSGASAVLRAAARANIRTIFLHNGIHTSCIKKAFYEAGYGKDSALLNTGERHTLEYSSAGSSIVGSAIEAAASGYRTMCVISSSGLSLMLECLQKKTDLNAGLVTVVVGLSSSRQICRFASSVRMPLWLAESVSRIERIISDAADYSEIVKIPAFVYIPERYLYARCTVRIRNTVRLSGFTKESCGRKKYITGRILESYNRSEGSGRKTVIAAGDCADYFFEIISPDADLRIMRIDMPFPWPVSAVRTFASGTDECLVLEREDDYCYKLVKTSLGTAAKITGISVPDDTASDYTAIVEALRSYLGIQGLKIKYIGRVEERANHKMPQVYGRDNRMCPGCLLRKRTLEYMRRRPGLQFSEKIYCEKLRAFVYSGVKRENSAVSEYRDDMIIEPDMCFRESGVIPSIDTVRCTWCGRCLDETGCPALFKSGIRIRLDSGNCTGCGLCMEYCPSGSIIRQ